LTKKLLVLSFNSFSLATKLVKKVLIGSLVLAVHACQVLLPHLLSAKGAKMSIAKETFKTSLLAKLVIPPKVSVDLLKA